jgi:hypothetical protein
MLGSLHTALERLLSALAVASFLPVPPAFGLPVYQNVHEAQKSDMGHGSHMFDVFTEIMRLLLLLCLLLLLLLLQQGLGSQLC